MPKVSVIIPNYNHARFLEQRIETVLNQTYQNFEIIFLDDNSTDNSREVFSKYAKHPKISHAIFNETNSGSPFKQWNKGFSLARGEYIWIAESDDFAELRLLEELVKVLDAHSTVGIAYCESIAVDNLGNNISKLSNSFFDPERWQKDFTNSGQVECTNYLVSMCTIPNASAVLFRHSLYVKVAEKNSIFKSAGDWFTWASILLLPSDVYFLAQDLNYFRLHGLNTSRSSKKGSLVVQESLKTIDFISNNVNISPLAKERAFEKVVMEWWIRYLWDIRFSFKNEYLVYLDIIKSFSEAKFRKLLHLKLAWLFVARLRYNLALGSKLKYVLKKINVRA
ncbi:MAG TPA: glycosyltransferase [Nodularia sp. (in: cyanobacteria)]|nr:glycosyltransferase [Nodularia sp. (in: cyanobacteria)]